jgi:hypothetical protein
MQQHFELSFKGARQYAHGTDIYNGLLAWMTSNKTTGRVTGIDFSIHKMASTQLAVARPDELHRDAQPAVTCGFAEDGTRKQLALVETGAPITKRRPYDEDSIIRDMIIDATARTGELRSATDFSAIEIWVAMTKAVHLRVFDPAMKWLFVRARFSEYVRELQPGRWSVKIAANFRNKLTRNEISRDGITVGEIYFSPQAKRAGN